MDVPIGFIGLGNMGLPIATNLHKAGFKISVYNRSPEKAEPLARLGVPVASSPAQVVTSGGVVITMLANDEAVEQVMLGDGELAKRLSPGGIYVNLSTISPQLAVRLCSHYEAAGAHYVGAVVFGRPERASAGKLVVAMSGACEPKQQVEPILKAIGESLTDVGDKPQAANVLKLCGNFLIAATIESFGEAMALAEKNGIERQALVDLAKSSLFASPLFQIYAGIIAEHQYQPAGFELRLGLKDINLILDTASRSFVPMPLASLLRDRFLSALARGRADWDWASIALQASEDAGL